MLAVGGSDSGGGAGIQADVKTITALTAYAATAVTALTAQDTTGVHAIHPIPPDFIRLQIECVLADIGADAIKTGMLGTATAIATIAGALSGYRAIPLVVDPVMIAKGGHPLLATDAIVALQTLLTPLATLITPNVPEAEALAGLHIHDLPSQHKAAEILLSQGARAVLLKGGHLPGDTITDLLLTPTTSETFVMPRLQTRHTHGTGCTLASAVAAGLAQGYDLSRAVRRARAYVQAAIATAPGLGAGHGPLNHAAWQNSEPAA